MKSTGLDKNNRKNSLLIVWYLYKTISSFIHEILGVGIKKIRVVSGFEIEVEVINKNLYPIIFFLNKHTLLQCKSLLDIICYDVIDKTQRFCIVYNILSVRYSVRIRVISRVSTVGKVLSLLGMYRVSGWCEREVFDFFGIFFFENKDLRRILTDYGFKGFPLRKNFPLTGFLDTYYDDSQKRICYRTLELSQEYRDFNFKSTWRN
jgi:NADH:ubiquinone oxidoreductase subunit C